MEKISQNSIFHKHFLSSQISTLNPKDAIFVEDKQTVSDVLEIMTGMSIGSVLVKDFAGNATGIFTERDVITKLLPEPVDCLKQSISKFMSSPVRTLSSRNGISRAVYEMAVGGFRHIVITTTDKYKYKIISARDLVNNIYSKITKNELDPEISVFVDENKLDRFLSGTISQIPLAKTVILKEEKSVKEARDILITDKIGAVIIANDKTATKSIFTERDYLDKVASRGRKLSEFQLSAISTISPENMLSNTSITYAFHRICQAGFRHIPVVDSKETLLGILSVRSILQAIAKNILADLA